jgi:hypothetical protein
MSDPDAVADDGLLRYVQLVDSARFGVWGVALVRNGFQARLHHHPEAETYYFLWGEGRMVIGECALTCFNSQTARFSLYAHRYHSTDIDTYIIINTFTGLNADTQHPYSPGYD